MIALRVRTDAASIRIRKRETLITKDDLLFRIQKRFGQIARVRFVLFQNMIGEATSGFFADAWELRKFEDQFGDWVVFRHGRSLHRYPSIRSDQAHHQKAI